MASNLSEFLSQAQEPPAAPDQAEQAETVISEVAARFARCREWHLNDVELVWTRSCLLAASQSPNPIPDPVTPRSPEDITWSSTPRIAAAQGLPFLVANYGYWDDGETPSTVKRLWCDPANSVRLQIIRALHLFAQVAPEWAWEKVEESALRETHPGILVMLANHPLYWWFKTRHEEVVRLCIAITHCDKLAGRFSWQLPRALGRLIGSGFVLHASPTAQAEIDTWLSDIPTYTEFIKASLLWTDRYIV